MSVPLCVGYVLALSSQAKVADYILWCFKRPSYKGQAIILILFSSA